MDLEKININKKIKVIFMGTPAFSVPVLEALIENYYVRAIVTQPDRATDRHGNIIYSPVKKVAMEHAILTLQPEHIKDAVEEILNLEPDLIITCAYGQIIPKAILEYPKYGCINVHASLLPKLRGGAPIQRAIMNGYRKTGITIMDMDVKMDTGDIISQQEVEITDIDTGSSLHDKLMIVARDLLMQTLPSIIDGTATRTPQDESQATYGFNIRKEDERIDFSSSKKEIYNKIRALNSWPGAYCYFEGKILKVWSCYMTDNIFNKAYDGQITAIYEDGFGVKVENGEIVFTEVQLEGKNRMSAVAFINGASNKESLIGKVLD